MRAASLAGRFVLLAATALYLTPSELGVMGLVISSIAIGVLVVGLEFYAFGNREYGRLELEQRRSALWAQLAFHASSYVVMLPAFSVFFILRLVPWSVIAWWYGILILEHLGTEMYRLLIVAERPWLANAALFFRTAAWAFVLAVLWALFPSSRTLTAVWIAWLVGAGISVIIGIVAFGRLPRSDGSIRGVGVAWVRGGVRVMAPLFVASLCLKVVEYADRFFLSRYYPGDILGRYTFYSTLANVIPAFVYSGVVAIYLPQLFAAANSHEQARYQRLAGRMLGLTTLVSCSVAVALLLGAGPIIATIGSQGNYGQDSGLLWILLPANVVLALSWVAHYDMYARGLDLRIMAANLAGTCFAVVSLGLLVPNWGASGAAAATLATAVAVLAIKVILSRLPTRRHVTSHTSVRQSRESTLAGSE